MILEGKAEDLEGREPVPLREPAWAIAYTFLLALVVFVFGILWAPLDRLSKEGTDRFVWRPPTLLQVPQPNLGGRGGRESPPPPPPTEDPRFKMRRPGKQQKGGSKGK
jgi:hypothetical protein